MPTRPPGHAASGTTSEITPAADLRPRAPEAVDRIGRPTIRPRRVWLRWSRLVEGVAAGAGAGRVGVVDREPLLLDRVDEVDRRPVEVRRAHPVDDQIHTGEVPNRVALELPLIEEQLVAQPRAA